MSFLISLIFNLSTVIKSFNVSLLKCPSLPDTSFNWIINLFFKEVLKVPEMFSIFPSLCIYSTPIIPSKISINKSLPTPCFPLNTNAVFANNSGCCIIWAINLIMYCWAFFSLPTSNKISFSKNSLTISLSIDSSPYFSISKPLKEL